MRTIVELPNEKTAALKQLTETTQLSRAELMRRAVADYIKKHNQKTTSEAFGLWSKNPIDLFEGGFLFLSPFSPPYVSSQRSIYLTITSCF